MQSRKGAKLQQLNGENGEMPFQIPSNWLWLRLGTLFEVAGGIQKTPLRAPKSNAFPYLGVGNVYRGRIDLTTVKEFELQEGELERWRLEVGDLLIIEGNGSLSEIGRCAVWNGEIEICVHQNHVIRCRPLDLQISPFVLQFLNSPAGTAIMQRLAIASSGLYSLSVGKIRQIEVPLPPFAEQHRIVVRVAELMALCDQLEAQLTTTEADSRRLLEAVLHEALNQSLAATEQTRLEVNA
jgi:type I restriction enzyme S subunit